MNETLPCPNCSSPVDIRTARWCDCVAKKLSVVCPHCEACFCHRRGYPMQKEWTLSLQERREQQAMEKFRRAVAASARTPEHVRTVLVVDDDEEIRLIAEYTVQHMGYRVLTASDANEALELVRRERPDIVLTDALMPKMDGRELCKLIKLVDPAIQVVIMSALYTASRYRNEAMKTFQADDYLVKPISFGRLQEVLQDLAVRAA